MKTKSFFRAAPHQRAGLKRLCLELPRGAMGVEVGSAYGESADIFMSSGRVAQMLCVDTWEGDKAEREPHWDRVAAKWEGRLHKAKATSHYVAGGMEDAILDFVYIDANHSYVSVLDDIALWRGKVKPGGIICGHDYRNDVQRAVLEALGKPDKVFEDSSWMVRL